MPALPPTTTPAESAKPQEAPEAVLSKPPVDRSLPESLIGAPAKDLVSRNIDYGTIVSGRTANVQMKTEIDAVDVGRQHGADDFAVLRDEFQFFHRQLGILHRN